MTVRCYLEVIGFELLLANVRSANRELLKFDCAAQVKIIGDDTSILAAAEYFLSKNQGEIINIVRPLLEKQVRTVLGPLSSDEIRRKQKSQRDPNGILS